MASVVNLIINDTIYTGWLSVSVNISIENLSGTFQLTLTDRWAGLDNPVVIKGTDSCVLTINNQVVITGYIDRIYRAIDGKSHTITISGRDKSADLIDCSIVNGTGQYKMLSLVQIANRICEPFGINVTSNVATGAIFKTFNVEQGSSAYEALQKLCQARACLAVSNGLGDIVITQAGTNDTATPLVEGINILQASAENDYSYRFSQYIVKGQSQGNIDLDVDSITGSQAVVNDDEILRYRPLVIVADGQADSKNCETRALWEKFTRKGRSRRFQVKTAGWIQPISGQIWALNQLITLQAPSLSVFDKLLVVGITFDLSDAGEIATLELTSPDAYLTIEVPSVDSDLNPYIESE